MKKIIIACLLLLGSKAFAQDTKDYPKNEVKLNILNVIAIASVELGYEYFVDFNQSIEAEVFFNDRFSYFPKDGGKYKANSFKLGYNYYFDLEGLSGPYINPFIKTRFGEYKKENEIKNLDSFILGIGVGYLWNYNDTFTVAPYVNIARNFGKDVTNDSYFWAVEPNAGLKIGYRF